MCGIRRGMKTRTRGEGAQEQARIEYRPLSPKFEFKHQEECVILLPFCLPLVKGLCSLLINVLHVFVFVEMIGLFVFFKFL